MSNPVFKFDIKHDPQAMVDRIRQHIETGNHKLIQKAAAGKLTRQALNNILKKDIEGVKNAHAFKNGILGEIASRLPDLRYKEHVDTYQFLLGQMQASQESQQQISDIVGKYKIKTNIPETEPKLLLLRFNIIFDEPFFPVFFCSIKLPDIDGIKICDGFIFISGSKIVLSGVSQYANIFASFGRIIDPMNDYAQGIITVENRVSSRTYTSSAAICAKNGNVDIGNVVIDDTYLDR